MEGARSVWGGCLAQVACFPHALTIHYEVHMPWELGRGCGPLWSHTIWHHTARTEQLWKGFESGPRVCGTHARSHFPMRSPLTCSTVTVLAGKTEPKPKPIVNVGGSFVHFTGPFTTTPCLVYRAIMNLLNSKRTVPSSLLTVLAHAGR